MSADRPQGLPELASSSAAPPAYVTEIEIKLAIPKSAIKLLKAHPLLATAGAPKRNRVRSIYFDTPELALREHRAALRVRHIGREWIQTFKHGGNASAGMHSRTEAECAVPGAAIDLVKLHGVPGAELLARKRVGERLIQVFETVFTRNAWRVFADDGSEVEVALDQGDVWSAGRSLPLCEVEIELIAGDPAALYRLALAMQETLPLRPEDLSKAERGYRLYSNEEAAPARAAPIRLDTSMRPADALVAVVSSCVAHLQANAEGAERNEDPEYVHQMRVALRRLRAAIGVFAKSSAGGAGLAVNPGVVTELRQLASELGSARDWDVFIEQTLQPLCAAFPQHAALSVLKLSVQAKRDLAYRRLNEVLGAQRYTRMLLQLAAEVHKLQVAAATLEAPGAAEQPNGSMERMTHTKTANAQGETPVALRALARAALNRRHKRLARDAEALRDADGQHRHSLRIDSKKLRYAAEFFSGLFEAKSVARYTRCLAELQDLLGRMNDIVTAHDLLNALAPEAGTQMVVESWLAAREHDALAPLPEAIKRLAAAKKFWKRG